jgi:hypothetical protein
MRVWNPVADLYICMRFRLFLENDDFDSFDMPAARRPMPVRTDIDPTDFEEPDDFSSFASYQRQPAPAQPQRPAAAPVDRRTWKEIANTPMKTQPKRPQEALRIVIKMARSMNDEVLEGVNRALFNVGVYVNKPETYANLDEEYRDFLLGIRYACKEEPDNRQDYESVLAAIGAEPIGKVQGRMLYDGNFMDTEDDAYPGDEVIVVHPGWRIIFGGSHLLILSAVVVKPWQ